MTTHFLEVGSMREDLQEIYNHALKLGQLLAMTPEQRRELEQARVQQGDLATYADDVRTALSEVLLRTEDLITFLDQFESAPVIYTGEGNTAEVLSMLERLIALSHSAGGKP